MGLRRGADPQASLAARFDAPPIIIGGCGRSGTTLLASILSCHPKIAAIAPETRAFARGAYPADEPPASSPLDFATIAQHLQSARPGADRWCEKTPRNVHAFSSLAERFEGRVHLIHVVRDGRDVVCSFHPDDPRQPWISAERWVEDAWAGRRAARLSCVHTVRYEDLVGDFEATIRTLADALQLSDPTPLLRFPEGATLIEHAAWTDGPRPISATSIGRHRRDAHRPYAQSLLRHPDAAGLLRGFGYECGSEARDAGDVGDADSGREADSVREARAADSVRETHEAREAGQADSQREAREAGQADSQREAREAREAGQADSQREADSVREARDADSARDGPWHRGLADRPAPQWPQRAARAAADRVRRRAPFATAPHLLELGQKVTRLAGRTSEARPVFIVGGACSGVEIWAALLHAHPRLHVLGGDARAATRVASAGLADAYEGLTAGLDPSLRWVDPWPGNLQHVPALQAVFPRARFLVVTRELEDVVHSLTGRMGSEDRARRRAGQDRAEARHVARRPDAMRADEADLLEDPQDLLRRVMRFLNLPWADPLEAALGVWAPHFERLRSNTGRRPEPRP